MPTTHELIVFPMADENLAVGSGGIILQDYFEISCDFGHEIDANEIREDAARHYASVAEASEADSFA